MCQKAKVTSHSGGATSCSCIPPPRRIPLPPLRTRHREFQKRGRKVAEEELLIRRVSLNQRQTLRVSSEHTVGWQPNHFAHLHRRVIPRLLQQHRVVNVVKGQRIAETFVTNSVRAAQRHKLGDREALLGKVRFQRLHRQRLLRHPTVGVRLRCVHAPHGDVNDGATSHANGVCAGQHYHVGQGHFPLRRCALDALHGVHHAIEAPLQPFVLRTAELILDTPVCTAVARRHIKCPRVVENHSQHCRRLVLRDGSRECFVDGDFRRRRQRRSFGGRRRRGGWGRCGRHQENRRSGYEGGAE
mmetsp:Transcript_7403/g.13378  ORF Transcript_7403/g.13378 Transcript_7403/m.13378 type:complete len:300 (+) Transcript_7403:220-1119(+)